MSNGIFFCSPILWNLTPLVLLFILCVLGHFNGKVFSSSLSILFFLCQYLFVPFQEKNANLVLIYMSTWSLNFFFWYITIKTGLWIIYVSVACKLLQFYYFYFWKNIWPGIFAKHIGTVIKEQVILGCIMTPYVETRYTGWKIMCEIVLENHK